MSEFHIKEYAPFKTYKAMVGKVLDAIENRTDDLHPISEVITQTMLQEDSDFDEKVRRQYYEYQELHNAMTSFLDFYLIWAPQYETLSYDQLAMKNRAMTKTFTHIRNFLSTQKIE